MVTFLTYADESGTTLSKKYLLNICNEEKKTNLNIWQHKICN